MAYDDKYWDLELFESPKKEYPPMTTDDYRYIIAGIGKMIDEVSKAFINIHTASYRYRIIDRLNTLVSGREWKHPGEVDSAFRMLIKDIEFYDEQERRMERR